MCRPSVLVLLDAASAQRLLLQEMILETSGLRTVLLTPSILDKFAASAFFASRNLRCEFKSLHLYWMERRVHDEICTSIRSVEIPRGRGGILSVPSEEDARDPLPLHAFPDISAMVKTPCKGIADKLHWVLIKELLGFNQFCPWFIQGRLQAIWT